MERVISFEDIQAEKSKAVVEFGQKMQDEAFEKFDRIVSELAGDDQVLARVLRGRLVDAYFAGYRQGWEEDSFAIGYRYSWEDEVSRPT